MSMLTERLHSSRFQKRAIWISAAVFVAGAAALIGVLTSRSAPATSAPVADTPPQVMTSGQLDQKKAKIDAAAATVARKFVLTAVVRKDLRAAYWISGPGIRQGMTLKQWLNGNIAVVPFPANPTGGVPMKIDESTPTHALIEVVLLPAAKSKVKPQAFYMDLKKIGSPKHWVVDGWVPRSSPLIPRNPGN
jgi:hypothetical protein